MKKRIYMVDGKFYFLNDDNDVFEIEVENEYDKNKLEIFCNENEGYSIEDIPQEMYEDTFSIDWSGIEIVGNKKLIRKIAVDFRTECKIKTEKEVIIYFDYFENIDQLRKVNEYCMRNRISLLPFIITENTIVIGPYIIPGETCCYECKYQRMKNNDNICKEQTEILKKIFNYNDHKACLPENIVIAKFILCKIIRGIQTATENFLINTEIEINVSKLTIERYSILPWPACKCRDLKWIY